MTSTEIEKEKTRLSIRVRPDQKELIQFAADLEGLNLSAFIVSKLHEAAEETIMRHRVVALARDDSIAFVKALLNPPEPSETLRRAARDYNEYFTSEG